ncbi:MAG: hypothetical protein AAF485_27405, partial [Chloroflexota bacterium]
MLQKFCICSQLWLCCINWPELNEQNTPLHFANYSGGASNCRPKRSDDPETLYSLRVAIGGQT